MSAMSDLALRALCEPETLTPVEEELVEPFLHALYERLAAREFKPCACPECRRFGDSAPPRVPPRPAPPNAPAPVFDPNPEESVPW